MATDAETLARENHEHVLHLCNTGCAQTNPSSLILRLPHEILVTVFIRCACDHYYNHRDDWSTPGWVNVSYVCRRWRAVALSCPTLWSYHFVLSLPWTEELLARSKQASLNIRLMVDFRRDESWWLALLERLMNHGERIQELRLVFPYQVDVPEMLSKLSFRACRLQSLSIIIPDNKSPHFLVNHANLSGVPLNGSTPSLRELELSHCSVAWRTFSLNALTILHLRHIPPHFRTDATKFIAMLGSMQGLTQLYLDHALAELQPGILPTIPVSGSGPPKTDLPCLTRLLVAATFPTIITLLSCINIPSETELRLDCCDSPLEDFFLLSSDFLAHRLKSSSDLPPSLPTIQSLFVHGLRQHLELGFSSLERYNCNHGSFNSRSPEDEWGCGIPLKIFIDTSGSARWKDYGRIISDICRPLPLENVQSVHVIDLSVTLDLWRETFGRFPKLRHLRLSRGGMRDISSVLSNPPLDRMEDQGGDTDQYPVQKHRFAPSLQELELYGLSLFAKPTKLPEGIPRSQCCDLPSLLDVLSKRETRCSLNVIRCRLLVGKGTPPPPLNIVGWWEGDDFKVGRRTSGQVLSSSQSVFGGR